MPDASSPATPLSHSRKSAHSPSLFQMRVGIALGSNLGDRLGTLRAARQHLASFHEEDAPFLCSQVYETRPVGCHDNCPWFLNAAIELSTTMPPIDILQKLLSIENHFGRPNDHAFHAPRTLDLDLLYCDNLTISLDSLILPHPHLSRRLFVLKPLRDICPERIIPGQLEAIRVICDMLEIKSEYSDIIIHSRTF